MLSPTAPASRRSADWQGQARAAFAEGKLSRARRFLGKLEADALDGDDRGQAERLGHEVERRETIRRLKREVERHLAADDALGGLERVRRLAELAVDGEEARRWRERAAGGELRRVELGGPFECWRFDIGVASQARDLQSLGRTSTMSKKKARRTIEHNDFIPEIREPLIRRLAARFPDHTGFALLLAEPEADAGRWREVLEILRPIEIEPMDVSQCDVAHYHHLLGLALLYTGGGESEAMAAFEQGWENRKYGLCIAKPLIELVRPMAEVPEAREWGSDQPLVRQLLGAIKTADRALAAGDPAAAIAALERPVVWRTVESQSAARLAAAYLAGSAPADAASRYRRRLALAFFLQAFGAGPEILLPGVSWEKERLEELAGRARAWLDEPVATKQESDRRRLGLRSAVVAVEHFAGGVRG